MQLKEKIDTKFSDFHTQTKFVMPSAERPQFWQNQNMCFSKNLIVLSYNQNHFQAYKT